MADLNFLAKPGDKGSLSAPSRISANSLSSIFSVIAVIFTIGSIVAMAGFFLYYRYQQSFLADLTVQKSAIEDDLRPELVNRLVFVDSLLAQTRQLLQAHVWTSSSLAFLESTVHANVTITSFQLSAEARKLDLTLTVPSYLIFSEQVRLFEASPLVERVSFGSPNSSEKGTIFKVTINFKPNIFEQISN